MRKSKAGTALALATILGALAAILLFTTEFPPRVDAPIHEAIGRALAQEAVPLLGPSGKITVLTRDTSTFKQPAADIALASVRRELHRAGATLGAVQTLQVDPLRPVLVPPGDFFELIRRAAAGDVLISLMGPPILTDEQLAGLGVIRPKIVAFCVGNSPDFTNLRPLVEQRLLHAAVLSRPAKRLGAQPTIRGKESFDNLYVRAGSAELARLTSTASPP